MIDFIEVFPWNENFETGVKIIDEQHQRLVHLLNLLASHIAYQSDLPTLNNIFNELAQYASYHFATEEKIWHEYFIDDEWEETHKQIHKGFVSKIEILKAEEKKESLEKVIEDVLSFLTHWLAFHILESDKRMAKVVLLVESGESLSEAKAHADLQMSGAMKVLIETILCMYDSLSTRTLQLMREIMERQKAEAKLRLAANVFDNTLDAICITDENYHIVDVNPTFQQHSEYNIGGLIGKNLKQVKSGLDDENGVNIWEAIATQGHWSGIVSSRLQTGEIKPEWLTLSSIKNEDKNVTHYVAVFSNVSHLLQKQDKLERIAHYDSLTGLPNRSLFSDRLELAMAHSERTQSFLAVCYLDLDGFKPVNDQLGHAAGDQLLCEIAHRFTKNIRAEDTAARLGGDEFVILLGDLQQIDACEKLLQRLLLKISEPINIKGTNVKVSASIGITLYPYDDVDAQTLLQHADEAMYKAKKSGKSRYCMYEVAQYV